jgi:hypothetical protein
LGLIYNTDISKEHLFEGLEFTFKLDGRLSTCRVLYIYQCRYDWIMVKFISDKGVDYDLAYGQLRGLAKVNLLQIRQLKLDKILLK